MASGAGDDLSFRVRPDLRDKEEAPEARWREAPVSPGAEHWGAADISPTPAQGGKGRAGLQSCSGAVLLSVGGPADSGHVVLTSIYTCDKWSPFRVSIRIKNLLHVK